MENLIESRVRVNKGGEYPKIVVLASTAMGSARLVRCLHKGLGDDPEIALTRKFYSLAYFLTLWSLAGCDTSSSKTQQKASIAAPFSQNSQSFQQIQTFPGTGSRQPIFIIIGGYASCGTEAPYQNFLVRNNQNLHHVFDVVEHASVYAPFFAGKTAARYIFVCFGKVKKGYPPAYLQFAYDRNTPLDSVYTLDGPTGARKQLIYGIDSFFSGHDIHVVGHSWGAALALEVVAGLRSQARISTLVTIDAVDTSCRRSGRILPRLVTLGKCFGAPDVAEQFGAQISARVKRGGWLNFYQRRAPFLRGGKIAAAHNTNQLLKPSVGFILQKAHSSIKNMPEIWQTAQPHLASYELSN